jgi:chorismate mutase
VRKSVADTVPDAAARAAAAALANLDQRIGAAVAAGVGDLPARVRDEVGARTRTLNVDIAHEVTAQITAANIGGQLRDATKSVLDQVNTRFVAERAQTAKDVSETKADLQRQIIAESANAKNTAVLESRKFFDQQIKTVPRINR